MVFWILGVSLVAVGVHLYLYGRRRGAMLRRFARSHGLPHESKPRERLEDDLSQVFEVPAGAGARAFMGVRDVVTDGSIRLFRCVEALDLNRWGTSQNTNFSRIAALFPVDPRHAHWAVYGSDGHLVDGAVPDDFANPGISDAVEAILAEHQPDHALSLTLAHGQGILYLEPRRVGSETERDLSFILRLGHLLADRFGSQEKI